MQGATTVKAPQFPALIRSDEAQSERERDVRQRRRRFPAAVALAAALIGPAPVAAQADAEPEWIPRPVAVLQGLDKVTARISTVTAPVGEAVKFGTLSITVATCQEHPPPLEIGRASCRERVCQYG